MGRDAVAFEVEEASPARYEPGAFSFLHNSAGERVGIVHACPCGCSRRTSLLFRGKGHDGHDEWDVLGEWPKVTLSPSIGIAKQPTGGYHWHGFLEGGVFVE